MEAMSTKRRSLVYTGNDWADFEALTLAWLRKAAATSWQRPEATIVAVPTRSHGFFLREICLKNNLALAGVYFRTPGEFRDDLLRAFPQDKRAASREELRLFLSLSAARFPDEPLARSLARDSDSLLKSLDALWAAGHRELPAQNPLLEKILAGFQGFMDRCGLCTAHEIDRALLAEARRLEPVFSAALVYGFSGRHWPRLAILQALVHASESSTLMLWNPPDRAAEVDRLWIGTWEEELGPAEIAAAEEEVSKPLQPLSEAVLSGSPLAAESFRIPPANLRVGRNALEESLLVLAQILTWLEESGEARIAVLFPKANPCSRELSDLMNRMEIPHNDTLGHAAAHSPQERQWNLWLQLQEQPTLDHLRHFVQDNPGSFDLLRQDWRRMEKAFQQTLTDELKLISLWLHSQTAEDERIARVIDRLVVFPAQASVDDFIRLSLEACGNQEWKAYAQRIEQRAHSLQPLRAEILERPLFLNWLREVVRTPNRQRAASGHHPYARIQFLTYPDAELQPWTHVVFTGLNEGSWPPAEEEGGWLHSNEMELLNRKAVLPGKQGEGHFTFRPGFSRLLAPEERRALASRALLSLLEDAEISCCFTAALTLPDSPHRGAAPSDFLVKVYWALHGAAIDTETFNRLAARSAQWISSFAVPIPKAGKNLFPTAGSTVQAWQARRQPGQPFGSYDFCFTAKPPQPLWLPAKSWQQALQNPARIWLERVLRVSKVPRFAAEDPGRLAEGTWVHAWLRQALTPGETQHRLLRLNQVAGLDQAAVHALYQSAGRALPLLWLSQWEQALAKAAELVQIILAQNEWQPVATEHGIRTPVPVPLAGAGTLMFSGVIDLILSDAKDAAPGETNWAGKNLHVIDYKTGADKPLSVKRLLSGEGVQIALYLLALQAQGAARVTGQVLTPEGKFGGELEAEEAASAGRVWKTLISMQEEVRLGLRGELRPEFSFGSDYPLATLAIDPDLIEERWSLTHPFMGLEEE